MINLQRAVVRGYAVGLYMPLQSHVTLNKVKNLFDFATRNR